MTIKNPYRTILLVTITLLLLKNLVMAILLGDFGSLLPALVHVFLMVLIQKNHEFIKPAIYSWAVFYLLLLTGIKAGGKTLVIWSGKAWEIDMFRYQIDLLLVLIGVLVLIFRKKIFTQESTLKN